MFGLFWDAWIDAILAPFIAASLLAFTDFPKRDKKTRRELRPLERWQRANRTQKVNFFIGCCWVVASLLAWWQVITGNYS